MKFRWYQDLSLLQSQYSSKCKVCMVSRARASRVVLSREEEIGRERRGREGQQMGQRYLLGQGTWL
jgi:hypothetical protein